MGDGGGVSTDVTRGFSVSLYLTQRHRLKDIKHITFLHH